MECVMRHMLTFVAETFIGDVLEQKIGSGADARHLIHFGDFQTQFVSDEIGEFVSTSTSDVDCLISSLTCHEKLVLVNVSRKELT